MRFTLAGRRRFDLSIGPADQPLLLPQHRTEELLARALRGLGGNVERGVRVTGIEQDATGVRAHTVGPDGPGVIEADWLIGADGVRSTVRAALDVEFLGGQGLNLKLQDVRNLAWKLAGVVSGALHPDVLDTYERERRQAAEQTVRATHTMLRVFTLPPLAPGPGRQAGARAPQWAMEQVVDGRLVLVTGGAAADWARSLATRSTQTSGEFTRAAATVSSRTPVAEAGVHGAGADSAARSAPLPHRPHTTAR